MAKRIENTKLNASTIDILNTIRANASLEYQNSIPKIEKNSDIPAVGEILYGYPALANQFINALVNRIALVRTKSATFNNMYSSLKKGYLENGETIEEVFVELAKAREFSAEKAAGRELKRTLPDVRAAFHVINYRVQYPITIQDEDLRQAFLSNDSVQDFITRIVNSVFVAAEYDEFLLFKYLMIKGITHGKMYPIKINSTDISSAAETFRATSNKLLFINTKYNAENVHTNTIRESQFIFMDADFNAKYDINILASAFNMDKATIQGNLKLIDDWGHFDNERFSTIIEESDNLELVTEEELNITKNTKAVLVDEEWFQIYDNTNKMTENYVASGLYWNYFYNVWKTVSISPFSNAIVFVGDSSNIDPPQSYKFTITDKSVSDSVTVLTLSLESTDESKIFNAESYNFIQTEELTSNGIAVHKYGAIMIPKKQADTEILLEIDFDGVKYTAGSPITSKANVGDTITVNK